MMDENDPRKDIESVYDDISPFFSGKRQAVWPPIDSFLRSQVPGDLLDIGCGTGRVMIRGVELGWRCTGIDISRGQIETSARNLKDAGIVRGYRLIRSGMEVMPLEDESFDAACMIASLHHLPDRRSRSVALNEAFRVLRKGGSILISVWTWDQKRFREQHLSRMKGIREPDEFDGPLPGDFHVPWKEGRKRMRFYHLYGPGELEDEIEESDLTLTRAYFDGRNHWAEAVRR